MYRRRQGTTDDVSTIDDDDLLEEQEGLGYGEDDTDDPGQRLFALASHIPIGTADRYTVLSAPSAADRLATLSEAVDAVAEMVEFQLSE